MGTLPVAATAPLPRAQQRTFEALAAFIQEHGYPPSQRDLAERTGLASTYALRLHLKALERKGYIRLVAGIPRSISIVSQPESEAVA